MPLLLHNFAHPKIKLDPQWTQAILKKFLSQGF